MATSDAPQLALHKNVSNVPLDFEDGLVLEPGEEGDVDPNHSVVQALIAEEKLIAALTPEQKAKQEDEHKKAEEAKAKEKADAEAAERQRIKDEEKANAKGSGSE